MMTNNPTSQPGSRHEPLPGDLGYSFTPPDHTQEPGGLQLIIQIHDRPTYRHFDPEHVRLSYWTTEGYPDSLTLRHPWTYGEQYQGYPGRIHMTDRLGEEAHAFSFGGDWKIQSQDEITRLELVSTAPILDCNQTESIPALLADEVEILIAKQRAQRTALQGRFPNARQGCDPQIVYAACLHSLLEKYQRLDISASPTLYIFLQFLENAIAQIQDSGQWPANLPELDCMF